MMRAQQEKVSHNPVDIKQHPMTTTTTKISVHFSAGFSNNHHEFSSTDMNFFHNSLLLLSRSGSLRH
jgi:hypothetical protein